MYADAQATLTLSASFHVQATNQDKLIMYEIEN